MDQDSDGCRGLDIENGVTKSPLQSPSNALPIRERAGKRRAGEFITSRGPPLKRVKGDFNTAYLNLLNQDIDDVSLGLLRTDDNLETGDTQVGAVSWSAAEKNVFFAALSRLGKEDIVGVSARIGTKSEIEVRQYLALIREADLRGYDAEMGKGRHILRPVDVPAAVEISAECVAALEAAADSIALRQETYEQDLERDRWGSLWLFNTSSLRELENSEEAASQLSLPPPERGLEERQRSDEEGELVRRPNQRQGVQRKKWKVSDEPPFVKLFSLSDWLALSERIFMNSSISDGNWQSLTDELEPPAMQATAFADFYNLTLSVTKRLIFAAMWVADSRLRADNRDETSKPTRYHVRAEDVAVAVSSLGMKCDAKEFWARCARRLQLNVVNDGIMEDDITDRESVETDVEEDGNTNRDDHLTAATMGQDRDCMGENESDIEDSQGEDHDLMSYDEVETALGYSRADSTKERISSEGASENHDSSSDSSDFDSDNNTEENSEADDNPRENNPDDKNEDDLNTDAIARDIEEAMLSSSFPDPAKHTNTNTSTHTNIPHHRGLKARIRAEHRLERDAELLDAKASAAAEAGLWAVLRGETGTGRKKKKGER